MIVGRVAELADLGRLFTDVLAGRGRALLVRGEAGIGKTTLLEALVERGGGEVTVLRAHGVESEAELAFSALSDLLGPIADDLAALPAPQSAALASALALGPPQPGDRLAVCVATLGLLRAAGRRRPVLAVVDDVQWLDAPSRECVLYAARRAAGPVAFALAEREVESAGREYDDLPALLLGGLAHESSLELLSRAAPGLAPPVARVLADAAAGNPLALVELPATLSREQQAGRTALDLPLAPGARLQRAFAQRIDELPVNARHALLVAATFQGDDLATISAACAEAGTDVALVVQAEARGLARVDKERLAFGHPLIRGAIYQGATPDERRSAHRALAAALHGERRAWHLAAAAVRPDELVAAELERAAGAAAARRGFASASAALERAARLSPDRQVFARRMLAAGETAGAAGLLERALALLAEASGAAAHGRLRARAQHLSGLLMFWGGKALAAAVLLEDEAERAIAYAPLDAAAMLADAAMANAAEGDCRRTLALAERAAALLGEGGEPAARAQVLAMLSWALVLRGQVRRARPVLEEAGRLTAAIDPLSPAAQSVIVAINARLPTGEFERARAECLAICERAREAGALGALPIPLAVAADAAYRLGDWTFTGDAISEALQTAEEAGQRNWAALALIIGARLAAACGNEPESRRAAWSQIDFARSGGLRSGITFGHAALGFLELGLERVDEAIAELETTERCVRQTGLEEPTLIPWAPDLLEAYVRAGRTADAKRVLATLERQAAAAGTAWAGAALARCRGILEKEFDAAFVEALRLDDRRPMPFERARTLLAFGRRLHRARRRAEARERLREALAEFERLGAVPWAAQAQRELRAAGGRRRTSHDDSLTPQERRVAVAVARGASNREIAAELFLAPKTVEFHLRQLYQKLGVASRAQLVATLARMAAAEHRSDAGVDREDRGPALD
jgi:DNA-binding CsgD family transcriptional regulator